MAQKPGSFEAPLSSPVLWIIRVLALTAVGLASYLSLRAAEHGATLGCGAGATFDCDSVLDSSWARVLGMPVAMLGALCYAGIFIVSWLVCRRTIFVARCGMALLALLVASTVTSIAWFTGLQVVKLQTFCPYCLGIHLCGALIAIFFVFGTVARYRKAGRGVQPIGPLRASLARPGSKQPVAVVKGFGQFGIPIFLGVVGVVGLIGLQILRPAKTYEIATLSSSGGQLDAEPVLLKPFAGELVSSQPASQPSVTTEADTAASEEAPKTPSEEIAETPERHTAHRVVTVGVGNAPKDEPDTAGSELAVLDALLNKETKTGEVYDESDVIKNEAWTEGKYDIGFKPADFDLSAVPEELDNASRITKILRGRMTFDIYDQAYLGSPEAPNVAIELFDYTCKHCRATHERVHNALLRYGDQLAFVVMPVPLELRCNKFLRSARPQNVGACNLAKIALIVSKAGPKKFEVFHDWMMSDEEKPKRYEQALVRAYQQAGRDEVRQGLKDKDINERISRHVNLFANLGNEWTSTAQFGMPVFIAGDKISSGSFEDDKEYFDFIELAFDIEPVQH